MVTFDLEKIGKSAFLKKELELIKTAADRALIEPIPLAPLSTMKLFHDTGSRIEFENIYFKRRGILASLAICSMAYGDKKYIDALEDIIWSICEETTWAVTAHYNINMPAANYKYFIDLFSAETAFALAEIYSNLKDKLSDIIRRRIIHEVRERTITSFLDQRAYFRWEQDMTNNWAAVCAGGVFGAFVVFATKEETDRALPRLLVSIDTYLSGFEADGACTEGCGYWSYGFGYFTCFAQMLLEYSEGKIDLFHSPLVANIARFQQKVYLTGNKIVSFSDAAQTNNHIMGLTHFLYNKFDGVEVPGEEFAAHFGEDHCYRFAHIIRNFAWYDETITKTGIDPNAYYPLPESSWYINRKNNFCVAAKGGHNAEPHNQNDVGSFIIYKGQENILCDMGSGEYTRQYFSPQTRYSILCNGSQGHGVPIINGNFQKVGKEYGSTLLSYDANHFCVDIAKAYGLLELQSLVRTLTVSENQITLTDTYEFSDEPTEIVERFVSFIEPKIEGSTVVIKNAKLHFSDTLSVSVTKEDHKTHRAGIIPVYLINFLVKSPAKSITTEFIIE